MRAMIRLVLQLKRFMSLNPLYLYRSSVGEGSVACLQILSPFDGILENLEAVAVLRGSMPCPLWVLDASDMALGVGHQGKNAP